MTMVNVDTCQRSISPAVFLLGVVTIAFAAGANAGVWKGDVTHNGSPAAGAKGTICDVPFTTNSSGRFKLTVKGDRSSCPVKLSYQGKSSSTVKVRPSLYLSLSLRSGSTGWVIEVK